MHSAGQLIGWHAPHSAVQPWESGIGLPLEAAVTVTHSFVQ
jgi:hypothetical protein